MTIYLKMYAPKFFFESNVTEQDTDVVNCYVIYGDFINIKADYHIFIMESIISKVCVSL